MKIVVTAKDGSVYEKESTQFVIFDGDMRKIKQIVIKPK
jgi:hypothetical protein